MIGIQGRDYDGAGGGYSLDKIPDQCPFCHRGIAARLWGEALYRGEKLQIAFMCTHRDCQSLFLGYYEKQLDNSYALKTTSKGTKMTAKFSEAIVGISPQFVKIYQQADAAEQDHLLEIAGVGYRKAIEYLVKDYAIRKNPDSAEEIKKKSLGKCIEEYIDDPRVKSVAKRATWLGNDETHYVRQWEGKDLGDLKGLIKLTIHWLEMVEETEKLVRDMPEPK